MIQNWRPLLCFRISRYTSGAAMPWPEKGQPSWKTIEKTAAVWPMSWPRTSSAIISVLGTKRLDSAINSAAASLANCSPSRDPCTTLGNAARKASTNGRRSFPAGDELSARYFPEESALLATNTPAKNFRQPYAVVSFLLRRGSRRSQPLLDPMIQLIPVGNLCAGCLAFPLLVGHAIEWAHYQNASIDLLDVC